MARKKYTAEQIITQLREAEIELAKGQTTSQVSKQLEQENARLKKLVADLSLDNSILKEVSSGNF